MSWISIKDKLPELNQRIIIYEDGFIEICKYKFEPVWGNKKRASFIDEQDEQPSECFPTHWMPLPELPEEL